MSDEGGEGVTKTSELRGAHDLGGLESGPVTAAEHDYAMWENRIDAVRQLLSDRKRNMLRVDELRRGIESLGKDVYDRLSYYERWTASVTNLMIEKGVITADELGRKMAEVEARDRARFAEGKSNA
jgi:hypothetical protein